MDQVYQQRVGRCLGTLGEQFQLLSEHFFDFIFRHDVILLPSPDRRGFLVVPFIGLPMCYSVGTWMSRMRQILETIFSGLLCPVRILYIYPLSTKRPVSSDTLFCSSAWLIPWRKSSVFTHNPKSVNLLFCTNHHLLVTTCIDKYLIAY